MKSYKDLLIWKRSKELALAIYGVTIDFPKEELYGLASQVRRSSVSIPSNIAEGWGRDSDKNFSNFFKIAKGSLYELEAQLIIAADLKYLENSKYKELSKEIYELSKMMVSLIYKIEQKTSNY